MELWELIFPVKIEGVIFPGFMSRLFTQISNHLRLEKLGVFDF